jgi:hypothetical protein
MDRQKALDLGDPKSPAERTVGAALRVFIIMTYFTDRYHDILYS